MSSSGGGHVPASEPREGALATQSGLMAEANYRLGVPLRRVLGTGVARE